MISGIADRIKALRQVMRDGRITGDERALPGTLRRTLNITKREHDLMMEEDEKRR